MDVMQAARQYAYRLAKNDKVRFIEAFVHIEDKDAAEIVVPFTLWPKQKELIVDLCENRLNIILKARQMGISWLVLAFAASEMIGRRGYTVIGLSRTEEEAKELVRRMGVIFTAMPELIGSKDSRRDGMPWFDQKALELTIFWPDGTESKFKAFPSARSAARSFTANLILFDEWAFQQFAEEIWTAGFPTVNRPTGGKVIGLSTIERGSFFEKTFCDAPANGFTPYFLPWDTDPRRTAEWYENTKRTLGDLIMQEYPASVEEALTVPGGAFFPEVKRHTHVVKPLAERHDIPRRYCCIDYGLDMFSAHWIMVDAEGRARVYREFDAPNKTISEASAEIRRGHRGEQIDAVLAPPDMWNRSQESGKSRADIFAENGVYLTKTSNDLTAGCAALKEWLLPRPVQGEKDPRPMLTIEKEAAPNLWRCLTKIQKDPLRPDVYAKTPHDLTHDIDSIRCFAVSWTAPGTMPEQAKPRDFSFQRESRDRGGYGEQPSESFMRYV